MPIGRIGHAASQADVFGVIRPPRHDLKRIGRNSHFQRVMLRRPSNFKASSVSHLNHFEDMIAHRAHICLRIHTF